MALRQPKSPSCRRRDEEPRPVAFHTYDDIEKLLCDAVVGQSKYNKTILAYRCCSRGMKQAADYAVDQWCFQFSALQRQHVRSTTDKSSRVDQEEVYKLVVSLETLVKRAFGSITGPMRTFMYLSKVDRETYYAACLQRCVLCNCKLASSAHVEDSEKPSNTPTYTLSHESCQRKHMVMINQGNNPIPKGSEPRDLHRELYAVACSNPGGLEITRSTILSRSSAWYRSCLGNPRMAMPLLVWLRPHPRVRQEDTLYGALGITQEQVANAVRIQEEHNRIIREQSDARRLSVVKKTQELSRAYETEIRVWLGKGKTQWRNIEDLESIHEQMLSSTQIDRLIDLSMKRSVVPNLQTVLNTILLFGKTLEMMQKPVSAPLMDWIVRSAGVSSIFGTLGFELQHIEKSMVSTAVHNEAMVHAKALDFVETIDHKSVFCDQVCVSGGGIFGDLNYSVTSRIVSGPFEAVHTFTITHAEACKLKYVAASCLPLPLAASLPMLPPKQDRNSDSKRVKDYIQGMMNVCMNHESGMARATMLSHILDTKMFKEIVDSFTSRVNIGPVLWKDTPVFSEDSEVEDMHGQ